MRVYGQFNVINKIATTCVIIPSPSDIQGVSGGWRRRSRSRIRTDTSGKVGDFVNRQHNGQLVRWKVSPLRIKIVFISVPADGHTLVHVLGAVKFSDHTRTCPT